MTLVRKLQGRRATQKLTDDQKKVAKAEEKEVNEISTSQMSYDSSLDNFDKLNKLLASVPEDAPNESALTVVSLTALNKDFIAKNTAIINATVPLNNVHITRDQVLYKLLSGVVYISVDVKTYVKHTLSAIIVVNSGV